MRALEKHLFSVTLQFDPLLIHDQFSITHLETWPQKMCNATVTDIPLKRNLHFTCDISESRADLRGAFLVLLGICAQFKSGKYFF